MSKFKKAGIIRIEIGAMGRAISYDNANEHLVSIKFGEISWLTEEVFLDMDFLPLS